VYRVLKKYGTTDREFMKLFKEEGEILASRRDARK
jgi:hypothetical protein